MWEDGFGRVTAHTCENCKLFECYVGGDIIIGWCKTAEFRIDLAVKFEAQRLLIEPGREEIQPDDPTDNTHWLVYADWLDERGFPLQAEALRKAHDTHS